MYCADMGNRGPAIVSLAYIRLLDNSRIRQLADCQLADHRRLCVLSFPFWRHLRDRELSSYLTYCGCDVSQLGSTRSSAMAVEILSTAAETYEKSHLKKLVIGE